MKKSECEAIIKSLILEWKSETGVQYGQIEQPSHSQFLSWLSAKGYSHYMDFRSVRGARADVELWFDQLLGQSWRN